MKPVKSVNQYVDAAPDTVRTALRKLRTAIREAAPEADESISYGMPFYSFREGVGVEGRLCYFRVQQASIRLYLRPRDLDPHGEQIARYRRTKAALHFPLDRPLPISLIQKLVRGAVRRHRAETAKALATGSSSRLRNGSVTE